MSSTIGHIGEYEESREEWTQYAERLGHFLAANGIDAAEKKRSVFLSVVGPKTYNLLGSLLAPAKPGEKSYDVLIEKLKDHYNPAPAEIVERHKFYTRQQRPGENIATFVSELRSIAKRCNFEGTLEKMIRDRLVCGVRDDRLQRRLLIETNLDFKKAMEISIATEAALRNVKELHSVVAGASRSEDAVCNKVVPQGKPQTTDSCYRCGKPSHKANNCPFKTAKCHNCGKTGHIKRACRQPKKQSTSQVKMVQETEEEPYDFDYMFALRSPAHKPITVTVTVDGKPLTMEVDTGAGVSLISEETFKTLLPGHTLQPSRIRLKLIWRKNRYRCWDKLQQRSATKSRTLNSH